ncbi:MAG: dTMP kinase [Phycisphaerae bacterium]|nr:dTMP kinase [Phycisphaerae bacterium]HAW95430.1 dTMP kinase [Phycisphaerales bacterium]|tara:strand:- start:845 stop:1525 length:681 start_codon:yes stop_codon:yes gene_type:complete
MSPEEDTLFVDLDSRASSLRTLLPGRFIVLDGPDGCGKSTQMSRMKAFCLRFGIEMEHVREPGGTTIGEQIREILLDSANDRMVVRTEMLLYMASRSQLIAERIRPALDANRFVLADRFISSTLAYQGTGGGLSPEEIMSVGDVTTAATKPDLVVILDVDTEIASTRISGELDRMERKGRSFHERVRAGYLDQIERDPEHHLRIDAGQSPDEVFSDLLQGLIDRLS